jgi:hypothetical protein
MNLYLGSDIVMCADSLADVAVLTGELKDSNIMFKQDKLAITLLAQKITLDEYKMNDLLESLSYFVQFKVRANHNNYGLEMSLHLEDVIQ